MPRPQRSRRVCDLPEYVEFLPGGTSDAQSVVLSVDEYEAIRLIDLEKQTHEQCAQRMDVSRSTVTQIYESARGKIADSLVNGRRLIIAGGSYRVCAGRLASCCGKCPRTRLAPKFPINLKEAHTMKIAVTYENGQVFQHFGHTEQFQIYDTRDGEVLSQSIVSTNGSGHGALAGLLAQLDVDVLICGGIGSGARRALNAAGIQIYGGVSGSADEAADALLRNTLKYDPNESCTHHGEHGCDENGCGPNGCGGHACR